MQDTPPAPTRMVPHWPRVRRGYSPGIFWAIEEDGVTHMTHARLGHCTCPAGKKGLMCPHLELCAVIDELHQPTAWPAISH